MPKRDLEATSEALNRKHSLNAFSSVFREIAWTREAGTDPHLADFHVRQFVSQADDDVLVQLEEAEAPFWRHVREAIQACRKQRVA